jgi:cytochrome c-type biogenesis protein CcmH/NrfG
LARPKSLSAKEALMGWVLAPLLTLAALLGLWRFGRLSGAALQIVAAALLLALAGYAWQGNPSLAGSTPPPAAEPEPKDSDFSRTREDIMGRFDRAGQWLTIADGYLRRGDSRNAVGILRSGVRARPKDPDLWVGLGNALVVHAEGVMTPAAEFAFARASELAPEHPGPKFFYGMALIQSGRFAEAERAWADLVASAPANASWRPVVEQRLRLLRELRAMAEGPPPQAPAGDPGAPRPRS